MFGVEVFYLIHEWLDVNAITTWSASHDVDYGPSSCYVACYRGSFTAHVLVSANLSSL